MADIINNKFGIDLQDNIYDTVRHNTKCLCYNDNLYSGIHVDIDSYKPINYDLLSFCSQIFSLNIAV